MVDVWWQLAGNLGSGLAGSALTLLATRRKEQREETAAVLVTRIQEAGDLVPVLVARIEHLESEIESVRRAHGDCERRCLEMERRLARLEEKG